MNKKNVVWFDKLKMRFRKETCPNCKSYKVVIGSGYGGLKCLNCKYNYVLLDHHDNLAGPQVNGKKTLYEEKYL
jgi:transposase-like protein